MTALDDAELRTLAETATPGPWELRWMLGDENWPVVRAEGFGVIPDVPAGAYVNPADAAYIAAANPSVVLALLARAQTAEAKLAALEAQPAPDWEYEYADDDDPDGSVYGQVRRMVSPWEPVPDTRSET